MLQLCISPLSETHCISSCPFKISPMPEYSDWSAHTWLSQHCFHRAAVLNQFWRARLAFVFLMFVLYDRPGSPDLVTGPDITGPSDWLDKWVSIALIIFLPHFLLLYGCSMAHGADRWHLQFTHTHTHQRKLAHTLTRTLLVRPTWRHYP